MYKTVESLLKLCTPYAEEIDELFGLHIAAARP